MQHMHVPIVVRVVIRVCFRHRRVSAFVVCKIKVTLVVARDRHIRNLSLLFIIILKLPFEAIGSTMFIKRSAFCPLSSHMS